MDYFSVNTAQTAEEALDLMENTLMDAVIVDLRLPGIDGIEFIKRASVKWPQTRHIIYTGSPEAAVPQDIPAMDCVSSLIFFKPIDKLTKLSDEVIRITAES